MAEMSRYARIVRSYEISIWTLQDRFVSILKWATMDQKGEVQDPQVILRDDGTQEFTFSIPQYYQDGFNRIANPLWIHLDQQPLEANMHKLKVVFNKNTPYEEIFEFLVVSVTEDHNRDEVDITVKTEGLAFHELGKTGYRISLSQENFEKVENDWFDNGYNFETHQMAPRPLMNIQFWNDLIFKDSDGDWRTNWRYEIQMDWSAFSNSEVVRHRNILYEDAYVSSWELDGSDIKPRAVENLREKERPIEISESNYYNVTQTIAEQFGVFCRYEYEHNDRYEITGRKVIYYNNYVKDAEGHIDLTYPYSSQSITRTSDNTSLATKLYVHSVEDDDYGTLSIMNVDANKSREDYLLNFDYLIKIGAINQEQADDLKQFELDVRRINDTLIENQERTRIVENQLIEVTANVTYYDNARKLDKEQYAQAENADKALTGDSGMLPLEKSLTVMDGRDNGYGWYVNINWEGVDGGSILLYESRDLRSGQSGTGYKNPITNFQRIYDEYGNLIRLQNLSRIESQIDDSQIYIIGQFDPHTKYENVMNTWKQRVAIDEKKYNDAFEEEATLIWYLYGSRADYGIVGTRLDGEYNGIGIVWDDAMGPPPTVDDRNYNQYINYELDARILGNSNDISALQEKIGEEDITKISFDYFFDEDAENSTPDLYYYYQIYTKQKEKAVNAFERMMGPALREGYWQPEDYNDYGDVYYDSFIIGQEPKTPYLHFLWDHNKYYENEEPVIYQANTAGDMRQHMIINLSNYLSQIKNHLDTLCFGYLDPVTYATIRELQETIDNVKEQQLNKYPASTEEKVYTILDANYVSINMLKEYYLQNALNTAENNNENFLKEIELHHEVELAMKTRDINFNTELEDDKKVEKIEALNNLYKRNVEADTIISAYTVANNYFRSLSNNDIDYTDIDETLVENIINGLNDIYKILDSLKSYYTNWIDVENRILKTISDPNAYPPHSDKTIESETYPGHLEVLTPEKTKIDNLQKLINKVLSWYYYISGVKNQINTLNANKDSAYRTFSIGADCELGWIINQELDESEPIPVLIITGTDILSQQVLQYIQTGEYMYSSGIPNEYNESNNPKIVRVEDSYRPFIGYYSSTSEGLVSDITLEKLVLINLWQNQQNPGDFIGDASQLSITKLENNDERPIEISDYPYQRVYPRLYFSSLKLRDASSKLRIKLNQQELISNEDYYMVSDDRSKGIRVNGIGYYLTLRTELLYRYLCEKASMQLDVLYTLLNADTSIYLDAIKVSKENAFPKVSYDVQLSILNPEFIQTAYSRLNQIVHINDNDLKLEDVSGYISAVTLKLDKPWEDTVEIKNYQTKFEDLFSTIVAQTEAMKKSEGGISNAVRAFNAYGFIDSDILQDSILKADLNLQFNKGNLTISQTDGIWAISESGVVAFRGGGIFTATTQDGNGNWNWNTGILPTGINADLITSGQLDTNRIKIYAGNELRFQMNGQGLYAYKGYSQEECDKLIAVAPQDEAIIKEQVSTSAKKQYLLYNSEGLFLRAEAGAYVLQDELLYADAEHTIPIFETNTYIDDSGEEITYYVLDPITEERIQKTQPRYNIVNSQVDRVEISWEGLILRNWSGERVFYADPDTGDLTLKGHVEAYGGQIGGWTLNSNKLVGQGIELISGPLDAAGIQLHQTGLRQNTVVDYSKEENNILYIYNPVNSNNEVNENQEYYLTYDSVTDIIVTGNSTVVYINSPIIGSATPKYLEKIQDADENTINPEGTHSTGGETETDIYTVVDVGTITINDVSTSYYILKQPQVEGESSIYALDADGEKIIYNGADTYLNWLSKVQIDPNYEDYITTEYVTNYVPLEIGQDTTLILRPKGYDEVTFSVSAETGSVKILKGQIGQFIINDEGLSNGKISKTEFTPDNTFYVNGVQHSFGELFYQIEIEGDEIICRKLDGSFVNFNIAATQAYRNAVAAAGRLTLTLTVNSEGVYSSTAETGGGAKLTANPSKKANPGEKIVAVATSGLTSMTKDATVQETGVIDGSAASSSDGNNGICTSCHKSCFNSCAKDCKDGCKEACKGGCKSYCVDSCNYSCSGKCTSSCSDDCSGGCRGTCSGGCGNGCGESCRQVCSLFNIPH